MTILLQSLKKLKFIKPSTKLFQDFLHHPNDEFLFIAATDAHKVNLIPSLNSDKCTGPDSLLTKILKLLKKDFYSPSRPI